MQQMLTYFVLFWMINYADEDNQEMLDVNRMFKLIIGIGNHVTCKIADDLL